jgi:tetratricopeptide (TPR) repeat protein
MKAPNWKWMLVAVCALLFAGWKLHREPRALVAEGVAAFEAGNFEAAVSHFEQALVEQSVSSAALSTSAKSSATLQRNLALASLRANDLDRAAAAADALAMSGREQDLAWRDFLAGNLAWRRSEMAETEAHGPVPPAGAIERAVAHAEAAQQAWQFAMESQGDWPAAQRNLARVELRLATLREEQLASSGAEDPDVEKIAPPPDMTSAPLDPAEQERLMQQLERLDLQNAKRKAEEQPGQGGYEW